MALTTSLIVTKELTPQVYSPVLLCQFQMIDGSYLNVSTHPLNVAEGGYPYLGVNYLARVAAQDIQAVQIRSTQGIDRIPSVTIHLADADKFLFSNYEKTLGFKGAILTMTLIFWEADTPNFSSDSSIKFVGVCDAPQFDAGCLNLSIAATSSNNMGKASLPPILIQQRCGWTFPLTPAQRVAGASDMSSWQWGCGYDPDQPCTDPEIGGDARRGNTGAPNTVDQYGRTITDSAGNYILCDYTKTSCQQRGMYTTDSRGRKTGSFGGVQWAPVNSEVRSESYTTGKWADILSSANTSIYGDVFPSLYGTQWVKSPKITNILGDANSTRCEVIVCLGNITITGISMVVVNGVIVPYQNPNDALFTWRFVNTGLRHGAPNQDALYNGQGDPYGSLCTIEVVVYTSLAPSTGPPQIWVLAQGPQVHVPNSTNPANQATWPLVVTANPPWCLLDMMIWANWSYDQIDIQTFMNAAAFCAASISYINLAGNLATHPRFLCQTAITRRYQASEILQGVLQSFNAQLVRNNSTGLVQLYIRQTLADQQNSVIPGSNYNTPIVSQTVTGAASAGHVAYLINESTIARQKENGASTLRPYKRASADSPNVVSVSFQDADNAFSQDSISMSDADDIARAGGFQQGNQIKATLNGFGISNFDQAARVANTFLAEGLRGNEARDTRGTWYFDFVTTFKVEHLRVGHICLFQYQQLNLSPLVPLQSTSGLPIAGILVRIIKITPSSDYRSVTISMQWHEDIWYTDLYGQTGPPPYSNPAKRVAPIMPWKPNGQAPIVGDSIFAQSESTFGIIPVFGTGADGTTIAELSILGVLPVDDLTTGSTSVQPPLVQLQGTTGAGGAIAPGNYLIGIVATDSNVALSPLSNLISVSVAASNSVIGTGAISWQPNTRGYIVYAGPDIQSLSAQATGSGTPSSITLSALTIASYGPPDLAFDHLVFKVKRGIWSGVFGAQVGAVSANTFTFTGLNGTPVTTFTPGYYVGRNISLVARMAGNLTAVPVADFQVTANTASTFTVTPNPVGIVNVGDVIVMRTAPTATGPNQIGDSRFVGPGAPAGLGINTQVGNKVRIMRGPGKGQQATVTSNTGILLQVSPAWPITPTAASEFIIEESAWQTIIPGSQMHATMPNPTPGQVQLLNINNYKGQGIVIAAISADVNGNESLESYAPIRDLYVWGSGENVQIINANYTIQPPDQVLLCDSTNGPFTITMPDATINGGRIITLKKVSSDTNVITIVPAPGQQVEFTTSKTLVTQGQSAYLQGKPF